MSVSPAHSKIRRRRRLIRFRIRHGEPEPPKTITFAARLIVTLIGLVVSAFGFAIAFHAIQDGAWELAVAGGIVTLAAFFLIWSGLTTNRNDVCDAAVVFTGDFVLGLFW